MLKKTGGLTKLQKCATLRNTYKDIYIIDNKELVFIIIILSYNNYIKYKDNIDLKYIKETFRELSFLYQSLLALHDKAPNTDKSLQDLEAFFWATYPDADKVVYAALFKQLESVSISEDVGRAILDQINARKAALKLSEDAYLVSQGHKSVEDLKKTYDALTSAQETVDHQLPLTEVTTDLDSLVDSVYKAQGMRWRLNTLNKMLGSLRDGDFGFIFARPETGKTTFLASEVTSFLQQTDRYIVWLK